MTDSGKLHAPDPTFGKGPIGMLLDKSISDGAVRQYVYMHWRYGANKSNWEGRESVAEAMGVSERTVTNRNHELEQADWIAVTRLHTKHGNKTRNFYDVFESKVACKRYRKKHKIEKSEAKEDQKRKLRKGKGGKPAHKSEDKAQDIPNVNSGSDRGNVNSGSDCNVNSGSAYLDSVYPDSEDQIPTASAVPDDFKAIQEHTVTTVFKGNKAMFGNAGDIANWALCRNEKSQWVQWKPDRPFSLAEWQVFCLWYWAKEIAWPSNAMKWNKQAFEFRSSPGYANAMHPVEAKSTTSSEATRAALLGGVE